jgi:hypothetical protein
VSESRHDPPSCCLVLTVKALGVDLQQNLDGVAGPLSYLRRRHSPVQPRGHARMTERVGRRPERFLVGSWDWDTGRDSATWSEGMYEIYGLPQGTAHSLEIALQRLHADDRAELHPTVQPGQLHPRSRAGRFPAYSSAGDAERPDTPVALRRASGRGPGHAPA